MRNNPKLETRNPVKGRGPHGALRPKLTKLVPALLRWFAQSARDLPWRSRNAGRDPYAIWVSEIMLQQTQVKTVIPYWKRWMRELPTIESLARARSEKIHKLWEGLGYYTRVRNLQQAARQIVLRYGGKFPDHFDDILSLPGVGRYTAGAICSIAFNQPVPVLDGNVIRVLTRIFGIQTNPREKKTNARLWQLAEQLVLNSKLDSDKSRAGTRNSKRYRSGTRTKDEDDFACSRLNQSLMELGALVCTPRNPKCEVCPAQKLCVAFRENRVAQLPNLGKRAAGSERHFTASVVERDGRFLVRQRPAGVVNARLWEFPNIESKSAGGTAPFKLPKNSKPFYTVKHSVTRYRITLEAHRATLNGRPVAADKSSRWLTLAGMERLPFTSAHRKILEHLNSHGSSCVETRP